MLLKIVCISFTAIEIQCEANRFIINKEVLLSKWSKESDNLGLKLTSAIKYKGNHYQYVHQKFFIGLK